MYHEVVENSTGCTVFDNLVYGDAVYMCVGKTDRITVMKYNPNLKKFCIRKVGKVTILQIPLALDSSLLDDNGELTFVPSYTKVAGIILYPWLYVSLFDSRHLHSDC